MRGKSRLAVLVFFFSSASLALGADPQLIFVQEGGIAKTLSLSQMKAGAGKRFVEEVRIYPETRLRQTSQTRYNARLAGA